MRSGAPGRERRPRENRTRYVILGMLTGAPRTGYGLRKAIGGSVGHFWQESYGQLYPTLRRLSADGLVRERSAGSARRGATYEITERGRAELARWLARPPVLEPGRNELLLKVFFSHAVPRDVTVRNLAAVAARLRAYLAELEAIAAAEAPLAGSDPRSVGGLLTLQFGLTSVRMILDWLARAQETLRTPAAGSTGGGATAGARRRTAARAAGGNR